MVQQKISRKLAQVKKGTLHVGVDLGLENNAAIVINERAERLDRFRFPNDRDGYDYFHRRIDLPPPDLIQVQCYRSGQRRQAMPRKRRYSTEQIITKLREADVLLSQGKTAEEIARVLEISKQTYYRWRKEYGGLNMTQAKKLKVLEKENARLKTLVADLSLDNAIIKEVLSKNIISDASIGARTGDGKRSNR